MNLPLWLLRLLGRAPSLGVKAQDLFDALVDSGALDPGPHPDPDSFVDEAIPAPSLPPDLPAPALPRGLQQVLDPLAAPRPEELGPRGTSAGQPGQVESRFPIRQLDIPDEAALAAEMAVPWTYFRSSNVYSFHWAKGTLTVAFLPPSLRVAASGGGYATAADLDASPLMQLSPDEYMLLKSSTEPGPIYEYYAVPSAIYWYFRAASSKGKFVWRWLRDRYAYARVAN